METGDREGRQRIECYNCYRLIPTDSKFCPYCGHNQQERSGYTLRQEAGKQAEPQTSAGVQQVQPVPMYGQPAAAPLPYGYGQGHAYTSSSEGFTWVDLAKYAGVVGTVLFLVLLFMEMAGSLYGFVYLPQMDAFPNYSPFYFMTPFVVGFYAIVGPGYGIIYVLFVMIAAVCLAYVLRASKTFIKELNPISRGVQSSALFTIATLVMAYYFINMVVVLVVLGTGSSVSTPNFQSGPWYMTVWQLVFAPVWEEIAARVLLIGLPLLIVAKLSASGGGRKWWSYLTGGNFKLGPAAVFFLILSSAMFGLAHWLADSGWGFWKILPAAVSGLFMGYLFLKKGLFASIIFHFSIDSQALLILSPNSNVAVYDFVAVAGLIWIVIGAIFFIYYLLLMLSYISSRDLLPKKVSSRYATGAAAVSAPAPAEVPAAQQYAPQENSLQRQVIPGQNLHPYRPPDGTPIMRNPHSPVPGAPGEPAFGYICTNCGSLEARYKDGKFVCVYCGHESDK